MGLAGGRSSGLGVINLRGFGFGVQGLRGQGGQGVGGGVDVHV